jgi:hypothetical protein
MDLTRVKNGILHPISAAKYLSNKGGSEILRRTFDRSGIRVLDQDWDTLIIFDCARYDIFAEEIDLSGSLTNARSVASITAEFVERNFADRPAHDVVYLSANPVVGNKEEFLDIHKLVGVWHESERKKRGQENTQGLTDPKPVVERAKELHSEYPNKRHIIHFLPPHVPHTYRDGESLPPDSVYRNYEAAREGEVSPAEMRAVYAENLRYVIEQSADLIENIDGKVVLTADHGELLGEGMPFWMKLLHNRWDNQWHKYDYGHYRNVDVPELIEVPWFELPFENRREIISEPPVSDSYDTEGLDDKLEALGYRT